MRVKLPPESEVDVRAETSVARGRRSGAPRGTGSDVSSLAPSSQVPSSLAPSSQVSGTAPAAHGTAPTGRSRSGSASDAAIAEVLIGDETARARGFSGAIAIVSVLIAMLLPVLAGDPVARLLCDVVLVGMAAVSAWV